MRQEYRRVAWVCTTTLLCFALLTAGMFATGQWGMWRATRYVLPLPFGQALQMQLGPNFTFYYPRMEPSPIAVLQGTALHVAVWYNRQALPSRRPVAAIALPIWPLAVLAVMAGSGALVLKRWQRRQRG
jgi:hypothetical protein